MLSEISYCGALVKDQDRDRFLLSMFAPSSPSATTRQAWLSPREALWALFAFHYEIAKTREVVSETQLGLIRLQWWRDAVAAVYEGGDVPEHEVLRPLAEVIRAYDLHNQEARDLFDMLIYAREFDLEDVLPADMEGVLHYADYTSTPLMQLAGRIAGADVDSEPVQVIAVNYALAGILRSVVHFARGRRCLLPEALMHTHVVSVNQLYELKRQDGLRDVVAAVAEEFVPGVRAQSRFLRAVQGMSEIYMGQIRRCGYDVFHPRMSVPPAFKELRLFFKGF